MLWGNIKLLDTISLPNATTWTCMVLVLIVMLFVRFSKPLQWRHWDLLLLFLLTWPLLYLRESQEQRSDAAILHHHRDQLVCSQAVASVMCATAPVQNLHPLVFAGQLAEEEVRCNPRWYHLYGLGHPGIWRSYLWLLIVTALLLFRSLFDLGLDQRAEFRSNVTTGGMIWLTGVMIVVMLLKAFLPEWRGVPQPQHQSMVIRFMTETLHSETIPHILALTCQLLIVLHLFLIGWMHFKSISVGVAASLLYLLMPYTAVLLLNTSQVVASLFIVLALAWYRLPMLAGLFLGLGTGFGFFPVILVPAWLGFYYKRGHGRFLFSYLSVIGFLFLFLASYTGLGEAWNVAWSLAEWQAWKFADRPTADGLWNTISLHAAYRIPLFIAFVALVVTSAFWPHPKNLGQLISWSATLILGVQFWYADAGGTYILWYLPLLILQTVRPALVDIRPARINPETDLLSRMIRKVFPSYHRHPPITSAEAVPPKAKAG